MAFTGYDYSSGLAALGKGVDTFNGAVKEREQRQRLEDLGALVKSPNADFRSLAGDAIALGSPDLASSFMKMADERLSAETNAAAGGSVARIMGARAQGGGGGGLAGATALPGSQPTQNISQLYTGPQPGQPAGGQAGGSTAGASTAPPSGITPEQDLAIRTVIGEAAGEGPEGWKAVAGVISNRVKGSGGSMKDVLFAPNQFEPWGSRRNELLAIDPNSERYRQVASAVLPVIRGEEPDPTGGSTHFYGPRSQAALGRRPPSWDDGSGQDIGNHRFFRLGYGGSGPNGTGPAAGAPARPSMSPVTTAMNEGEVQVAEREAGQVPNDSAGPRTVDPANVMVIGDSLGEGILKASGASGNAVQNRSPRQVLNLIGTGGKAQFGGRDIVLSSGISNDPNDLASVERQVQVLKAKGAKSVTLLGVGDRDDFVSGGVNDSLQEIASKYPDLVRYQPLVGRQTEDRVHLADYAPTWQAIRGGGAAPNWQGGDPLYGASQGPSTPGMTVTPIAGTPSARGKQTIVRDQPQAGGFDVAGEYARPQGPTGTAPVSAPATGGSPATWQPGQVPQNYRRSLSKADIDTLVGIMTNSRVGAGVKELAKAELARSLNDDDKLPEPVRSYKWARANGETKATSYDEWLKIKDSEKDAGDKVTKEAAARRELVVGQGGDPATPENQRFIRTGKEDDPNKTAEMKATEQKMYSGNVEKTNLLTSQIGDLEKARQLNPKVYSGNFMPGASQWAGRNLPFGGMGIVDQDRVTATTHYENLVNGATLSQGKELFGSRPTNYDEKLLQALKANPNMTAQERDTVLGHMIDHRKQLLKETQDSTAAMKAGTYFRKGATAGPPAGAQAKGGGQDGSRPAPAARYDELTRLGLSKQDAYAKMHEEGY